MMAGLFNRSATSVYMGLHGVSKELILPPPSILNGFEKY
jgi:hypothetical protein